LDFSYTGTTGEVMATIRDVAKNAGVAVGTVSRVLNERPDVDPILRERVERAIKTLGYRVNSWGRGLRRNSPPCVSFILNNRNFLHPVHSRILQGVEEQCDSADCFVLYAKFHYRPEAKASELRLPRVLRSHGIADCVILAGANYENLIEALQEMGTPYVLLANNLIGHKNRSPVDQVRWDDFGGAYTATKYLIQLGHRDIWYIGDVSLPWFRVPHEGYLRAMADSGLEPLSQTTALSDDPIQNGKASMDMLIERKRPLTAIFADCEVAHGAQEALRMRGLYTPRDVSIVALGEEYPGRQVAPFTTVRFDMVEVGHELAKMALLKIESPHRKYPEVLVPADLVKRGTCQPYHPSTRSGVTQPAKVSRGRQLSLKSSRPNPGKEHRRRRSS
jgi:LacI family transcriptional regulator